MKKTIKQWTIGVLAFGLMMTFAGITVSAQNKKDAKDIKNAIKAGRSEAGEATKVLNELMNNKGDSIPRSVLEKAVGIAVFTNIAKGGLIVGGRGGDGVIARRTANGWSAPVFYNIGGGNVGFQIGFEKGDFIMLFMQEGVLKDLLDDNLELGANVSFAAGSLNKGVSGSATATTTVTSGDEAVLTYSRSGGLFGGATVGGGTIGADNSRNNAFYKMNGGEVLANPEKVDVSKLPIELRTFTKTVEAYFK